MSLFGTTPPDEGPISPSMHSSFARSRHGLFDDDGLSPTNSNSLFNEDDDSRPGTGNPDSHRTENANSPWDLPAPRKKKTRAELLRALLPSSDVPEYYTDAFATSLKEDEESAASTGALSGRGVARVLAAAKLDADSQTAIMGVLAPGNTDGAAGLSLGRNEFNVLLALIGLAQEGDVPSLDGVDERRRNLPRPTLPGYIADPFAVVSSPPSRSINSVDTSPNKVKQEPFSKDDPFASSYTQPPVFPQPRPTPESGTNKPQPPLPTQSISPSMDYTSDDPWGTPDLHKDHHHENSLPTTTTVAGAADAAEIPSSAAPISVAEPVPASVPTASEPTGSNGLLGSSPTESSSTLPIRTTSTFTTTPAATIVGGGGSIGGGSANGSLQGGSGVTVSSPRASAASGGWDVYSGGFGSNNLGLNGDLSRQPVSTSAQRAIGGIAVGGARTAPAVEEYVVVTLLPEKEGLFMFQHHNYEVSSQRRGSKVVRRYSDFVWLLECLHKRYPFRVLPLLPPKRVALNGNHLSNDGAFIEKRRRGLARFLNALVRHPVISTEQLVVMFLTVPTELSVWRKQATISVQDEFAGRTLPPGLEESLSPQLKDLFDRTRAGVRRATELYITTCNIMDRLVKRSEGLANDHARMALSLHSLAETSTEVYATDTNLVPLLNDGLIAMSKHLRTGQSLMEDEARAWDAGVLEDLKRQRDALVGLRDLFDRRERLDRDNIPLLEKRIQRNEAKLATLRAKHQAPETASQVKPGDIERVVEAIVKDKESIVEQHNRSVFVKECLRDELVYFQATQYHVSRWNQDWAQERVKYSEMLADNWRRLLDGLDGMPLGE